MKQYVLDFLQKKYFLKNEKTWEDLAKRVAGILPDGHQDRLNLEEMIKELKFLPSSPTLMNGNTKGERLGGLSSCFPMDITDSIEGIFEAFKEAAIVTKYSGGVGYNFSKLRSSREAIKSLGNRPSSGPLSFMSILSSILESIQQGGIRRGASIGGLSIYHPDILEFIKCKNHNNNPYTRLNISVIIPDSFYDILEKNPNQVVMSKDVTDGKESPLIDEDGTKVTHAMLIRKIAENAHKKAEPGILNLDIGKKRNAVANYCEELFSNPCAEFINIPYSSCNLGSLNLTKYVYRTKEITPDYMGRNSDFNFDWNEFSEDVKIATRFLDRVIDVNQFPIPKIDEVTKSIRPIGLGLMGLASTLMLLGIPYGSDKAVRFTKKVVSLMNLMGMRESSMMSHELGGKGRGTYPVYDEATYMKATERYFSDEVKELLNEEGLRPLVDIIKNEILESGVRNSCNTSIAPTGSIGVIAETSSGVEPAIFLAYNRKVEEGRDENGKPKYYMMQINDEYFETKLANIINRSNLPEGTDREKIINDIIKYSADNGGSIANCDCFGPISGRDVEYIKDLFRISKEITVEEHLNILEAAAKYSSTSVSKTINMPSEATVEDVELAYKEAHKRGIIGVTVYREGSLDGILVANTTTTTTHVKYNSENRPTTLKGKLYHVVSRRVAYYIGVGILDGVITELFTGINHDDQANKYYPESMEDIEIIKKANGDKEKKHYYFKDLATGKEYRVHSAHVNADTEALTRSISMALRNGTSIGDIVRQLEKVSSGVNTMSKMLIKFLKHYIKEGSYVAGDRCPECGSRLLRFDGCKRCESPSCNFQLCG